MKRAAVKYSVQELTWIEARKELPRRDLHAKFTARFNRTDVSHDHLKSLCKRNGWLTGRTGCYEPGSVPANKGKKMPFNANCARTQFKKGQMPHNTKYLGHEHVTKDGYVEISVAETNPHTGAPRRYVQKHRHLWEQENGPVPEGMCLKSRDGDKSNTDPSNWTCIPRAMLPRLNGRFGRDYDAAPPEVKPVLLATAKLEHEVREAKRANSKQKNHGGRK